MCFCGQNRHCLATNPQILIVSFISIIILHSLQSLAFPERLHEKCIPRSKANEIYLNCHSGQRIAIFEAFFTTSFRHRCGEPRTAVTQSLDESADKDKGYYIYPRPPLPCTDDLRLTLNRRCSGVSHCNVSLAKDHTPKCVGEDGTVIVKHTCVSDKEFHPFCNLNFTSSYGYVSTPGYPKFYPPYDNCHWNIEGGAGQVVVVDLLDVAIKEPVPKGPVSAHLNRKRQNYECSDQLVLIEGNNKMLNLCGEVNSNLLQFRTTSNALTIQFKAHQFSPTRGLLFRYSLQNCPTLAAPKNSHLMSRNASFAYYSCCDDYVFEDTKEVNRVLYCENGHHWNASLANCVHISELSITSSLTLSNDSSIYRSDSDDKDSVYISDILIPIVLMAALLIANAVIVWVIFKLRRKQNESKNNESNLPLNSRTKVQTSV